MKKISIIIFTLIIGILVANAQQTVESPIGDGSTGCLSLGPDNDGYCNSYSNPSGGNSYTCYSSGAGCINCKK